MKYRIYTQIGAEFDRLYLGINGDDLIVDATDEEEAIRKSVNWTYDTSKYSVERTADWLSRNKLYCEQVEPVSRFTL